MDPIIQLGLYLAEILVPLHLLMWWQLARLEDPERVREEGVVVNRLDALDALGDVIGRYSDLPIYGTVRFKGMLYFYECVVPSGYRGRVRQNELYLDPGLLYLTRA